MPSQDQICLNIMICQMTAILSAVAMLYLSASLIVPSLDELSYDFNPDPIMCTTMKTVNLYAGGKTIDEKGDKIDCEEFTCNEWCLSIPSSTCEQVTVMPRLNGSDIDFLNCENTYDGSCSGLNISRTAIYNCKKPQCTELRGVFNCSKGDVEYNPCTEITPAYNCSNGGLGEKSDCSEICIPRLDGVYWCEEGSCYSIKNIKTYKDCERKCSDLSLNNKNVVMFSKERLLTTKCSGTTSSVDEITRLNNNGNWKSGNQVLVLFCTYITKMADGKLHTGDCFNATLDDFGNVRNMKTYLDLLDYKEKLYERKQESFLIPPEESLRIMNDTLLKINAAGCVNTLKRECKSFFETHDVDGSDGRTRDRYRCYYSNKTDAFVLGKSNPRETFIYVLIASIVPGSLFVISCLSLFICSKVVGTDESGHLKIGHKKQVRGDAKEL